MQRVVFRKIRDIISPSLRNLAPPVFRTKPFVMSEKFLCPVARGMTKLDRLFFQKDIQLLVAKFPNPRFVGDFVKLFKNDVLNVPRLKHIVSVGDSKGVLLRDDIDNLETYRSQVSPKALMFIDEHKLCVAPYQLKLDYDFWKADDILQAVLPTDLLAESPSGYAQAGHIAHMNLRDEFKPFGSLIGQVILDKNPTIKTVVDKLDTINNKFRVFDMCVLAGEHNFITEQHESGCTFRFDFSKAFWNSRLNTEHERLISQFHPGEVVCDVFAGVGPFAIPAGKKNVLVLANDLNPDSYKYLIENAKLNRVLDFVKGFNLDGREFIRNSPKMLLDWQNREVKLEKSKPLKRRRLHSENSLATQDENHKKITYPIPFHITNYVMNLPGTSIDFLDEFIGLYSRHVEVEEVLGNQEHLKMPIINVHCFEKYSPGEPEPSNEEIEERLRIRINDKLQFDIPKENYNFHLVRKVAPTKPMYCVSFELPRAVAFKKLDHST